MQGYTIYVTEPDVIDVALVKETLGDTPHTITLGNTDFTEGNYAACDTVIIRSQTHIDASLRQKMPKLRQIVRIGTGLDAIDLEFCRQAGITVHNAPGANAAAVADYVITMTMMVSRKIHRMSKQDVQAWNRFKFIGQDIASQTIGIVGFGHIGRQVYERFTGLGCRNFMLYDPFVTDTPAYACSVPLEGVMRRADVVTLHLPLLPQTRHCIGERNLRLLKRGAVLLNAARGGIVNESAVLEVMRTKQFTYVVDTVEHEPYVNQALVDHPNVLITPHIASLTHGAERAMVVQAVTNLLTKDNDQSRSRISRLPLSPNQV